MKSEESSNYGIVVLAAGGSKRLGSPKQLVDFKGKNLLSHTITTAQKTGIVDIVVVIGGHAKLIQSTLVGLNVIEVVNTNWKDGMSTSIVSGLNALLNLKPNLEGIIIMPCDQPFVTHDLLCALIDKYKQTTASIVASGYNNILGCPAFFHKSIFPNLLALKGDTGAKLLIRSNPDLVETISFVLGSIDIDTAADLDRLTETP